MKDFNEFELDFEDRPTIAGSDISEYDWDADEDEVRCAWCKEYYPITDCRRERELGYLCPQCQSAIKSRGEELVFIESADDKEAATTIIDKYPEDKDLKEDAGIADIRAELNRTLDSFTEEVDSKFILEEPTDDLTESNDNIFGNRYQFKKRWKKKKLPNGRGMFDETPWEFKKPVKLDLSANGNVDIIEVEAKDEALARRIDQAATELYKCDPLNVPDSLVKKYPEWFGDEDPEFCVGAGQAGFEYFEELAAIYKLKFNCIFDDDDDELEEADCKVYKAITHPDDDMKELKEDVEDVSIAEVISDIKEHAAENNIKVNIVSQDEKEAEVELTKYFDADDLGLEPDDWDCIDTDFDKDGLEDLAISIEEDCFYDWGDGIKDEVIYVDVVDNNTYVGWERGSDASGSWDYPIAKGDLGIEVTVKITKVK